MFRCFIYLPPIHVCASTSVIPCRIIPRFVVRQPFAMASPALKLPSRCSSFQSSSSGTRPSSSGTRPRRPGSEVLRSLMSSSVPGRFWAFNAGENSGLRMSLPALSGDSAWAYLTIMFLNTTWPQIWGKNTGCVAPKTSGLWLRAGLELDWLLPQLECVRSASWPIWAYNTSNQSQLLNQGPISLDCCELLDPQQCSAPALKKLRGCVGQPRLFWPLCPWHVSAVHSGVTTGRICWFWPPRMMGSRHPGSWKSTVSMCQCRLV